MTESCLSARADELQLQEWRTIKVLILLQELVAAPQMFADYRTYQADRLSTKCRLKREETHPRGYLGHIVL